MSACLLCIEPYKPTRPDTRKLLKSAESREVTLAPAAAARSPPARLQSEDIPCALCVEVALQGFVVCVGDEHGAGAPRSPLKVLVRSHAEV